jgi:hypothetical protein
MALQIEVTAPNGETLAHAEVEYGTHCVLMSVINEDNFPLLMRMSQFYGPEGEWSFSPDELPLLVKELDKLENSIRETPTMMKRGILTTLKEFEERYETCLKNFPDSQEVSRIKDDLERVSQEKKSLQTGKSIVEHPLAQDLIWFLEELKHVCDVGIKQKRPVTSLAD